MKKHTKKKISKFIKRRLIVLILIVLACVFVIGLPSSFIISRLKREAIATAAETFENVRNKIDRSRTVVEDVEIFKKLSVHNVNIRPASSGNEEIITGVISNNSDKTLSGLKLKLTFLNTAGESIETLEYDDVAGTIKAKSNSVFAVVRKLHGYGSANKISRSAAGMISDFNVAN